MEKELLFSVTTADVRFDYFKGSGPGGQHRNKTASAVRCTHEPSGAVGKCESERSQHINKKIAFGRMGRSKEFQQWARLEGLRRLGVLKEIEQKVDIELRRNTLVEIQIEGRWVPETQKP